MVFTGPNPFIKIPACTVLKESGVQFKKERALLSYVRFHNEEAEVERRERREGGREDLVSGLFCLLEIMDFRPQRST